LTFLDIFSKKKHQISNFIKIRLVGAELFHADGRADMTKLIVTFRNSANAPVTWGELDELKNPKTLGLLMEIM
jgi:hypothetical protein